MAPLSVVYQSATNTYQIFGVDKNNTVQQLTWNLTTSPGLPTKVTWQTVGNGMYDISAVASGADRVTIFGRGAGNNFVWIKHFEKGRWWTFEDELAVQKLIAAGITTGAQAQALVDWTNAYSKAQLAGWSNWLQTCNFLTGMTAGGTPC